jgi:hypothetical protein
MQIFNFPNIYVGQEVSFGINLKENDVSMDLTGYGARFIVKSSIKSKEDGSTQILELVNIYYTTNILKDGIDFDLSPNASPQIIFNFIIPNIIKIKKYGLGYLIEDTILEVIGDGTNAIITPIIGTDYELGQITDFTIVNKGSNYTTNNTNIIISGSGKGVKAIPVITNGEITNVTIDEDDYIVKTAKYTYEFWLIEPNLHRIPKLTGKFPIIKGNHF